MKIYSKVLKLEKALDKGSKNVIDKTLEALKPNKQSYAEVVQKVAKKSTKCKTTKPSVTMASRDSPISADLSSSPSSSSSNAPASFSRSTPPLIKTTFMQQPKILYVGDSVAQTVNLRHVEKSLKCRIRSVKANSTSADGWPNKNFRNVVDFHLKNPGIEKFDSVVMSAPSVDITNIDEFTKEEAEMVVINSCKNMVKIAEEALEEHRDLTKVVIMEHSPRFDNETNSNLAILANSTLSQLWVLSPHKDRIAVGRHSLESPGIGSTHLGRYKNRTTGQYDGVHLYGSTGVRDYTDSIKTILMLALFDGQAVHPAVQPVHADDHTQCEQAQYQWQQMQRRRMQRIQPHRHTGTAFISTQNIRSDLSHPVPTQNRFRVFNQGNY